MRLSNFISGSKRPPNSGRYLPGFEPAVGAPYCETPDSDDQDVNDAVEAARRAFAGWSTTPVSERSRILHRIADTIEENLEELAAAESRDTGKPLELARTVDLPRAALNFRFFAGAVVHFASEAHETDSSAVNYTLRQPIGVAGCISPWNLPLYLFTWKIAPAIASGNCVVGKPSEITPVTAARLAELCDRAGLPAGVLNVVHGTGPTAGAAIVRHPHVKAITFTGGTKTGASIAQVAAPMFKKLSLELGGKNPNIIFADCDYDRMLATTIRSSFSNQGQICLCGSRILVERSLYERFVGDFSRVVSELAIGDPNEPTTKIGAVVSAEHQSKILSYVELAREEGGSIMTGGEAARLTGRCADGWFVQPTVITGLDMNCRTNQEEIFGPVVTVMPFDGEDEGLQLANATEYGLSATVWTNNLGRAHRMAARLESGIVWINCWMVRDLRTPFGGVKSSGVGREGGEEVLRFFTEPKNVCVSVD